MSKTVTLRVNNETYDLIKLAADGEKRTLSNFIEYAILNYLSSDTYVSNNEMEDILKDKELISNLKSGLKDIEQGEYRIVQ